MPNPAVVEEKDPWLDDEFANVDFRNHAADLADDLAEIQQPYVPVELETPAPEPTPDPEPVAVQPVPEPEPEGPEVIELDGGGTLTIEKKGKKWCASLDAGAGGVQNFYGQNKNELLIAAFKAQANATRKIRELNRQAKLGLTTETPKGPTKRSEGRALTADEVVSIKLKLETNPDLAFEEWFQTKTGMNVQDLVRLAKSGQEAKLELSAEQVNKEFLSRCPEFYPDAGYDNFASLVTYIAKHKLGRAVSDRNQEEVYQTLLDGGYWTVQNLETAFHDLNDDGLLISKPRARAPENVSPQVSAPTPAAAPAPAPRTDERIVRTETRPRASLGIRTSEVAPAAPPPTPKLPSVEDYDSMAPEQLLAEIRRARQAARLSGRR